MPEHSYTVKRNGSNLTDGWRLCLKRDGELVQGGGIFTPNGGWDSADDLAKDKAHEAGRQWVDNNTPKAEIPW